MSPETVTGRFPFLLPGRRRRAAAGWSRGALVDHLSNGRTYSQSVMRIVDVFKAFNCRCKSVRWIIKDVPWPTDKMGGRRRLVINRRTKERVGMRSRDVEETLRCVLHILGDSREFKIPVEY
ncbi:hypothetical protein EVAR_21747_1 [Eumeta japonica]|uniref:Uncharacterized protein n=1 Tax=Eumeta variegata TaxID=151549 RepID=A0A4C1ZNS3_EUMVA|nr:hypothetical protein EVAR_21747_1 [Eumeta japonica]